MRIYISPRERISTALYSYLSVVAAFERNHAWIGLALRDLLHHSKRKHLLSLHAKGLVIETQEALEKQDGADFTSRLCV